MVRGLGDIQPLAKDLNVNAGSYQPSGWYAMGYISPDLRRSTVPEPLDFTYLKGVFPRGIMVPWLRGDVSGRQAQEVVSE